METASRHQCLIYKGSPLEQLPALAALMREKLDENYRCLYLNSPPMVSGMRAFLADFGYNLVEEIVSGRLVLTSESTLSPDGSFDIDLMLHKIEDALDRALSDGYKGLWATGDMTWEFGNKENLAKLLEYEWRLEELMCRREDLCGICQYHQDTLPPESMRHALLTHPKIFVNETLSRINPHYAQARLLSQEEPINQELDEAIVRLCRVQE